MNCDGTSSFLSLFFFSLFFFLFFPRHLISVVLRQKCESWISPWWLSDGPSGCSVAVFTTIWGYVMLLLFQGAFLCSAWAAVWRWQCTCIAYSITIEPWSPKKYEGKKNTEFLWWSKMARSVWLMEEHLSSKPTWVFNCDFTTEIKHLALKNCSCCKLFQQPVCLKTLKPNSRIWS